MHNYKGAGGSCCCWAAMDTIKGIYSAQEVKLAQHEAHVTELWT
jgi:hypothetical protein